MKVVKILGIALVLFVALLIVLPFAFKGKIVKTIQAEANKQLNATLSFNEDISISLLRSFPNLSITLNDLSIANKAPFAGDTLFSIKEFNAVLDLMSVIRGEQILIRRLALSQPSVNAKILPNGQANWDITMPDSSASAPSQDTTSSAFSLKLRKLEIKEGNIVYDDQQGNMKAVLTNMNYEMEGDFSDVLMTMVSKLNIAALTFEMEGIPYLNKVNAAMEGTLEADLNAFKFTFKEHSFKLNALELGLDGFFAMPGNDMQMDLSWNAKKNDIAQFLSLIPAVYATELKDLQTKGNLALKGFVKGTYNETTMPAFGLDVNISNGWMKYTALPHPLEDLQVDLKVSNPDGEPDHTRINLEKLHWKLVQDVFDAKLIALTPISDPYIDALAKGRINLNNIGALVPMPEGTRLAGVLTADAAAKGNLSTLDKGNYEAFDAKGTLMLDQFVYAASDLAHDMNINKAELSFSPKVVNLKSFDAKIGSSDMQMNGALENFFAYSLANGTLKGNLNFGSTQLNANEWMTETDTAATTAPTDTAAMTIFEVPDNIDFVLRSNIKKLLYTNMEITNFAGEVKIANRQIDFNKIALNLLGSAMTMNGYYETKDPMVPKVRMDFTMTDLDIQQAFKTFNTVQKLAPAAENISGKFSTNFKMYTALTQHMQPDYNSLLADGILMIPQASVTNIQMLSKVADFVGKPEYKQMSLTQAKIAWKVLNGKVYTQPFDVKLGKQTLNISGTSGLDQSLDYHGILNVPMQDLGSANTAVQDALKQLNAGAGTQIKTNDILPVALKIGGTFTLPTLTTNIKELLASQAGNLKQQAMDEARKKAKELEDQARAEAQKQMKDAEAKARAEAEKVKAEAEAKMNAEKERLKAEAEAKKKEAEAKAKAEADKLKKQAEEEAKKKLKGLLK